MLSNEVVARARKLVGEHVLENLLAVSEIRINYCFAAIDERTSYRHFKNGERTP